MSESVSTSAAHASAPAASAPSPSSPTPSANTQSSAPSGEQNNSPNPAAQGLNNQNQPADKKAEAPKNYLDPKNLDSWVKIKIDGVEQEMPVKEALRLQSLEKASQAKMREASQAMKTVKEVENFVKEAMKNPEIFFKEFGLSADDFAEGLLAKKYELAQMTPEQKELWELKQWKQGQEQRETQSKQSVISEIKDTMGKDAPPDLEKYPKEQLEAYLGQQKQKSQEAKQAIDKDFTQALQEVGFPKNPILMSWVAAEIVRAGKNGQDLSFKDAASKVKTAWMTSFKDVASKMSPEEIQQALGEETMKRVRQSEIDKVSFGAPISLDSKRPDNQSASEPKKYMNQMEWRKAMGIV